MPTTMQAVVKAKAAPGIELREVPVPTPGPGEVLVRVQTASVCGTDLHIYNWDPWAKGRIHPPLIPGHEFCGAVAGVGRGVTTVKEGDLVSAARVAFGGISYKPWRSAEAEAALIGAAVTVASFDAAGRAALKDARGYGCNDFKIPLARRTLRAVLADATGVI